MTHEAFLELVDRLRAAWNAGSADGAAACFTADVDYADPRNYRFGSREALLPFFEPPPGGHRVTWHRVLWDEPASTGVLEYTYEGHHRWHGAAIVETDASGLIRRWREWQHRDDERDWESFVSGPG